jgi:hypothetical protein
MPIQKEANACGVEECPRRLVSWKDHKATGITNTNMSQAEDKEQDRQTLQYTLILLHSHLARLLPKTIVHGQS